MSTFEVRWNNLLVVCEVLGVTAFGVVAALLVSDGLGFAADLGGLGDSTILSIVRYGQVGLGYLVISVGYLLVRDAPWRYVRFSLPTRRDVAWMVALLLFVPLLSAPRGGWFVTDALSRSPTMWVVVFASWFLVSVPAEEILVRGIVQGRLREQFAPSVAVVSAAVLFGAMHVPLALYSGGTDPLSTAVVTALIGGVLGTAYERTDNLVVPTLVHATMWISPALLHFGGTP
ncbi:CPBP family intramembrane glutamic endopeptidase [Halorussus sp. MSC15.2]|uniref:CPBP family intramembrane glutamic endopeptidase n=1 Tax=Halorussus sp. MSC15.2 TaxID=2283638 RepID=UPI0013D8B7CE|nr:type II CAAX endopeptidase family protein [Halorussus sp. MSC15.2]NEU57008.1 CPBP family intramembrane metalloprotease [Halorussus sp. MSC15.2]